LRTLWHTRQVIAQLGRRQVVSRHRGSMLGVLWTVLNPLLLLVVYTLFFTVFRPVASAVNDRVAFVLSLFTGMIVFGVFSETVSKAATTITGNPNYVKKVVFPLETLPAADLWASLVHAAVNVGVLLAATVTLRGSVPWTALLLPITLPPLLLLTLGIAWIVASLGVYVRDVGTSIGVVLTALMFLTPVFYSVDDVPSEPARAALRLNPLTDIVETTRSVLLRGDLPDWGRLAFAYVLAALIAQIGWAWFRATKRGFADVL
ncbi:MAG TPA: ABC transporter permease, partial [Planctomycetota bacterium]|nr:ABC transporter permease [Planctomycetota bacterium]